MNYEPLWDVTDIKVLSERQRLLTKLLNVIQTIFVNSMLVIYKIRQVLLKHLMGEEINLRQIHTHMIRDQRITFM